MYRKWESGNITKKKCKIIPKTVGTLSEILKLSMRLMRDTKNNKKELFEYIINKRKVKGGLCPLQGEQQQKAIMGDSVKTYFYLSYLKREIKP